MLIIIKLGQKQNTNIAGHIVEDDIEIDTDSSGDIIKLTSNPIFKKFSNYLTILTEAESKLVDSDCNYITISGPPGSGKTENLRNLISDINENTDGPVLYFQGECKKNDGAELATPYDVFHQALGSTLTLDLF